jgi:hypothetical protein
MIFITYLKNFIKNNFFIIETHQQPNNVSKWV